MKKHNFINILVVSIAMLYNLNSGFCQSTSSGPGFFNTPSGAGDYLGWKSGTNATLLVKNEDNNPINFLTNTGAGGTTRTLSMVGEKKTPTIRKWNSCK